MVDSESLSLEKLEKTITTRSTPQDFTLQFNNCSEEDGVHFYQDSGEIKEPFAWSSAAEDYLQWERSASLKIQVMDGTVSDI